MRLLELQQAIRRSIMGEWPSPAGRIVHGDSVTVDERIAVYENNVFSSLSSVLQDTFQTVTKLVGEEFFTQMAKTYIPDNLPEQAPMYRYGGTFPAFISTYEPAEKLPYLGDVALMDWYYCESFFASDEEPASAEEIQKLTSADPENISISLLSHVRTLQSPYAVDEIRNFCATHSEDTDETLEIRPGEPISYLIAREGHSVFNRRISPHLLLLMTSLSRGENLLQALERLPEQDIPAAVQELVASRVIRSIHVHNAKGERHDDSLQQTHQLEPAD